MTIDISWDPKFGWNPKAAKSFVLWQRGFSKYFLQSINKFRKHSIVKAYAPYNWHPSELHSRHGELQHQVYEQIFHENPKAGILSGYFTYKIKGTSNCVKELSLLLQGHEDNHNQDVERFLSMLDHLAINVTGNHLPNEVKKLVSDKQSKTQDVQDRNQYIDSAGYGYCFSNFNAASARETWTRQYVMKIRSPDRTAAQTKRIAECEKVGRVYGGFDPSEWGLG